MYKLVIADDELLSLNGLKNCINRMNTDFEIVGAFKNGREAADYIDNNPVDALLTDIRMPKMTGLELVEYLHLKKYKIQIGIISGYSEFEYAKKAMEYGVSSYLLKPVDPDELKKTLDQISQRISLESIKKHEDEELRYALLEQIFQDIIAGVCLEKQELKARISRAGWTLDPDDCTMMIVEINSKMYKSQEISYGKDAIGMFITNIIRDLIPKAKLFRLYENENVMYLMGTTPKGEFISLTEETINNELKNILNIDICGINIKYIKRIDQLASLGYQWRETEYSSIITSYILSDSRKEVFEVLEDFISRISIFKQELQEDKVKSLMGDINANISPNAGIHKYEDYQGSPAKRLREFIQDILLLSASSKELTSDYLVKKAKEYIEANYSKDISRDDVAKHIFITPVYFSRIFKQLTGETFMDYLIKVRMNNAIEMLKNGYKINDTAKASGYPNRRYFSRVFKFYTGYIPSQYKRVILNMEDWVDEMD